MVRPVTASNTPTCAELVSDGGVASCEQPASSPAAAKHKIRFMIPILLKAETILASCPKGEQSLSTPRAARRSKMKHRDLPTVLYEDEFLLAIDKPAGLPVAPDRWNPERPNLMKYLHETLGPAIANVHRLDAGTTGVFLCTKTRPALTALARDFEHGRVRKLYLALVRGSPSESSFTIDLPLAPDPVRPGRMCVSREGGRPAETLATVLARWRGYACIEAEPRTGRTHQIRVHLAARGCPIIADSFYGGGGGLLLSTLKSGYKFKDRPERPLIRRLALHARRLEITHPVTGAALAIEAPLPKDFTVSLKYLDRFAHGAPPWTPVDPPPDSDP